MLNSIKMGVLDKMNKVKNHDGDNLETYDENADDAE